MQLDEETFEGFSFPCQKDYNKTNLYYLNMGFRYRSFQFNVIYYSKYQVTTID